MSTPPFAVCPECRELTDPDAEDCSACGAESWLRREGEPDPDEAQARVEELIAQADAPGVEEPPERRTPWYRRPAVLVAAALELGAIVLAVRVYQTGGPGWLRAVAVLAPPGFAALLLYLLTYEPLCRDRPVRPTGAAALRAYFEAVAHGRWGAAHRALSPFGRLRSAVVPRIPYLRLVGGSEAFDTPQGVARYWRRVIRVGLFNENHLLRVRVEEMSGPAAVEAHRVTIDFDPRVKLGAFAIGDGVHTVGITFDAIAVKHRSQYWVLTGEMCSPIDRLLAAPFRG